jgi:signal transduction histidine kinase
MKRLGIAAKLVCGSACILTGLGLLVTWYSVSQLRGSLYQEMVRRVEAQTLNWIEANTSQIILSGNPQILDGLVVELKKREGIAYVILLDIDGRQRAAIGIPEGVAEEHPTTKEPNGGMRWREMKDARGLRYFELGIPVSTSGTGMNAELGTLFGVAAQNPTWGEVRVGVDRQEFERGVSVLVRKNVALSAALILLAVALSFVFANQMVTPITLMGRAANQIAAGNLSERVQRGLNLQDEVGDLVRNFNRMATRLEENREEMNLLYSGLEEKVRERTKELEQANRRLQELDQLKSDFLSTVSHELRTPLTSVKAYSEILLDSSSLDPETKTYFLGIIEKEADRMTRLISDLLDLTKIESGTATWMMSDSDLGEILRRSVAVLAPNAAEKQIEVRVAASEPQPVWADADRIQEVITNLVGNAVKFCSSGGRIEVKLERATSSGPRISLLGEYVLVTVEDTGLGMVPEERERVFEKFYQGTKSRSIGPGTGLGLAISKEIVLHHRGEIWVESEPGVGSKFYFTLPLSGPRGVAELPSPRTQPEEEGS